MLKILEKIYECSAHLKTLLIASWDKEPYGI